LAQARIGGFDLAFFGDSITDGWRDVGEAAWARSIAPLSAANFGIAGDRTQQVLWRMMNGELEGLDPKVVALLIGTNNLDPGGLEKNSLTPQNTAAEIIVGVQAIVKTVRARLPTAIVLLQGILPRGLADAPVRQQIVEINAGLRELDTGDRTVCYLDLSPRFVTADGSLTGAFKPDRLHLNETGYDIWADALKAPLAELLSRG
jgi:lysophospholipase L1-like esterase